MLHGIATMTSGVRLDSMTGVITDSVTAAATCLAPDVKASARSQIKRGKVQLGGRRNHRRAFAISGWIIGRSLNHYDK
jgi:hypothetical protein